MLESRVGTFITLLFQVSTLTTLRLNTEKNDDDTDDDTDDVAANIDTTFTDDVGVAISTTAAAALSFNLSATVHCTVNSRHTQ